MSLYNISFPATGTPSANTQNSDFGNSDSKSTSKLNFNSFEQIQNLNFCISLLAVRIFESEAFDWPSKFETFK